MPMPVFAPSRIFLDTVTPMPGSGTTKDENHPHPSLPPRGGGIKGEGAFSYKCKNDPAVLPGIKSQSAERLFNAMEVIMQRAASGIVLTQDIIFDYLTTGKKSPALKLNSSNHNRCRFSH
jgi:hypothetical protein